MTESTLFSGVAVSDSADTAPLERRDFFMEKIWLPPLEVCCKDIKISFVLAENLENHMYIECKLHGSKFQTNPFSHSKYKIRLRPSEELNKLILANMTKREKRIKRFIIERDKEHLVLS